MRVKRFRRLRAFALTFAASFLLLSAGAAFAVQRLTKPQDTPAEPGEPEVPAGYVPREEDETTVLLIGSDEPGGAARYFTLLRFNVSNGDIPVLAFPGQTVFEHEEERLPAGELADEHGAEALRDAVEDELGITIDHWVRWDGAACAEAVNLLGAFDFALSENLYYNDGVRRIDLMRGLQRVDGKKYFDMAGFPGYMAEDRRCSLSARLLVALLNARAGELAKREEFFAVLDPVESNITAEEHERLRPMLEFYAGLDRTLAYHVACKTEKNAAGEVLLSELARGRVLKYFGEAQSSLKSKPRTSS